MGRSGNERKPADMFVNTFTYLQVIVDDYILPIPRCLNEHFRYDDAVHYGYLAAPPGEYGIKVDEMIRRKLRQVFLFVDVLRAAYECERVLFYAAFDRLASVMPLPDMDDMEQQVRDSIQPLQQHMGRSGFRFEEHILPRKSYYERLQADLWAAYSVVAGKGNA